jgi:hypothetical protein
MRFWDASAVIPLLVREPASPALLALAADRAPMLVWWGTEVECASALARLEREGALAARAAVNAFDRLARIKAGWYEVDPSDVVREAAVRLLRVHALRAADALQLAAAFAASERRPATLTVVTLDDRLMAAARREGFSVEGPGA